MRAAHGILRGMALGLIVWVVIIFTTCSIAKADVVWDNKPTYGSPIEVIDVVVGTIRPEKRDTWREYRNKALDMWGLSFHITKRKEATFPYLLDETINTVGVCPYIVPGAITLWRTRTSPPFNAGGYVEACGGGIAQLDARLKYTNAGVIAHEVGHALGLGHTLTGSMGGALRVSIEEQLAVRSYYG